MIRREAGCGRKAADLVKLTYPFCHFEMSEAIEFLEISPFGRNDKWKMPPSG
jgi:hypothetical protein